MKTIAGIMENDLYKNANKKVREALVYRVIIECLQLIEELDNPAHRKQGKNIR